jgi:hypothetical protein
MERARSFSWPFSPVRTRFLIAIYTDREWPARTSETEAEREREREREWSSARKKEKEGKKKRKKRKKKKNVIRAVVLRLFTTINNPKRGKVEFNEGAIGFEESER